jgi:hypothetical protein
VIGRQAAAPGRSGGTVCPTHDREVLLRARRAESIAVTSSLAAVLAMAAAAAAVLLLVGAGFQAVLAAGAPWGAAAYGGRLAWPNGILPARYRPSSALTVVVVLVAGYVALLRGGVVGTADPADGRLSAVLWALAALFVVNTVGNIAGQHPVERWGTGGLTGTLAVLCALLAAGA